jgi:hypothetical protein
MTGTAVTATLDGIKTKLDTVETAATETAP